MCKQHCNQSIPIPIQKIVNALHCPTRWRIVSLLSNGKKSTRQIYHSLLEDGETLTPSGLYYHLSALVQNGIVELEEYREKGRGAPEKIWRLKKTTLTIDLVKGKIR